MKNLLVLLPVLLLSACSGALKLSQEHIQAENGTQIITIPEAKAKITYHGDYDFHDYDNKFYPIVRTDFWKGLKELNSKETGKLLYAGHSFIRPIFASTAILYHQKYNEKSFTEQLKKELKSDYEATNLEINTFGTKAGEFYQLTYFLENPVLKIKTQHVEYIGILREKTIRILFWTIDSNEQTLFRESEAIMKTLNVKWY